MIVKIDNNLTTSSSPYWSRCWRYVLNLCSFARSKSFEALADNKCQALNRMYCTTFAYQKGAFPEFPVPVLGVTIAGGCSIPESSLGVQEVQLSGDLLSSRLIDLV